MPYPAQINRDIIIETARDMLEANGLEHLSLAKLAAALGVKAPSLYRHVSNKTTLLQEVNQVTYHKLVAAITVAMANENKARRALMAMMRAYREFAHQNPVTYTLAFSNAQPELRPDAEAAEQLAIPLQAVMGEVVGEQNSLPALRGAWALTHGFVMLELSQQFQRSGDVDMAFEQSIQAYIMGWNTIDTFP